MGVLELRLANLLDEQRDMNKRMTALKSEKKSLQKRISDRRKKREEEVALMHPRGVCPFCIQSYRLKANGMLRRHSIRGSEFCRGANHEPSELTPTLKRWPPDGVEWESRKAAIVAAGQVAWAMAEEMGVYNAV